MLRPARCTIPAPDDMSDTHPRRVLITGCAGFIGSTVVEQWLRDTDWQLIGVDRLGYAGLRESLSGALDDPRFVLRRSGRDHPQAAGAAGRQRPGAFRQRLRALVEQRVEQARTGAGQRRNVQRFAAKPGGQGLQRFAIAASVAAARKSRMGDDLPKRGTASD